MEVKWEQEEAQQEKQEKYKQQSRRNRSSKVGGPVGPLTLHRLRLLPLGIKDREFELSPDFTLVTRDEEEVEGEVVLGLFVKALGEGVGTGAAGSIPLD